MYKDYTEMHGQQNIKKKYLLLTCDELFVSPCLRQKTDVEVYVLLTDAGSDHYQCLTGGFQVHILSP
jgi:hypothetical protein